MNITNNFWDFIEKYLPDYHTRDDILRQSDLQLFLDGKESSVTDEKISVDQAQEELNLLLLKIYHEAIQAYTAAKGADCEHCSQASGNYCPSCGKKLERSKVDSDPVRCRECGSTDVQYAAWLDTNTGEFRGIICGEESDLWCESCQSHTRQVSQSEFIKDVDEWWEYEDALSKQEISRIELQGFCTEPNPEEAFDEALKKYWKNLSVDEKIKIWCSFIYPVAE